MNWCTILIALTSNAGQEGISVISAGIKEAIIATSSIMIGTILGWVLGKINFGRLHVSLSDFKEEYLYTIPYYIAFPGKKDNELYDVRLHFKICLYNSSPKNKTMRNCALEFFDNSRKLIFECPVKDEDSKTMKAHSAHYNDVEVINVPANESYDVKSFAHFNHIEKMNQIKTIRFRYADAKFKKHYLKYKTIDFQKSPRFNLKEDNGGSQNGQNEI